MPRPKARAHLYYLTDTVRYYRGNDTLIKYHGMELLRQISVTRDPLYSTHVIDTTLFTHIPELDTTFFHTDSVLDWVTMRRRYDSLRNQVGDPLAKSVDFSRMLHAPRVYARKLDTINFYCSDSLSTYHFASSYHFGPFLVNKPINFIQNCDGTHTSDSSSTEKDQGASIQDLAGHVHSTIRHPSQTAISFYLQSPGVLELLSLDSAFVELTIASIIGEGMTLDVMMPTYSTAVRRHAKGSTAGRRIRRRICSTTASASSTTEKAASRA